ncbi:hypothetical protein [Candidatus Binatus sp.]|uniref:hypothetical protein n=1 Tax=Candidatus Binatus sp. TaxID=2811406 RepID=UPI003CC61BBA
MKHLSICFAVILIASALLPNAANNLNATSTPSVQRSLPKQPNEQPQHQESYAKQPTPLQPTVNAQGGDDAAHNSAQGGEQPKRGIIGSVWVWLTIQRFFNLVVTIATALMAIFTYQLVHGNRPILILEKESISGVHSAFSSSPVVQIFRSGDCLTAQVTLRNAGVSPAIIDSAIGHIDVTFPFPKMSWLRRYRACPSLYLSKRMFAPEESADIVSAGADARQLTEEEFQAVMEDRLRVFFYGVVKYGSILSLVRGRYRSTFLYVYLPPHGVFTEPGIARWGGRRFNKNC